MRSTADVDWWRFTIPRAGWVQVHLGDLGANYALSLHRLDGTLVARSDRGGTTFEELYLAVPAGSHLVRVTAPHGTVSARPYMVRFRLLPDRLFVHSAWYDGAGRFVAGEILNNTGTPMTNVAAVVYLHDDDGRVVAALDGRGQVRAAARSGVGRSTATWGCIVPAGETLAGQAHFGTRIPYWSTAAYYVVASRL